MVRLAAAFLVLALAGSAGAAATVYHDRAAWESAVTGSLYTETFESVPHQLVPAGGAGAIHTPMFDIVDANMTYPIMVADGIGAGGSRGFGGTLANYDTNPLTFGVLSFARPIVALAIEVVATSPASRIFLKIPTETYPRYGFEVIPPGSFIGVISDAPFTSASLAGYVNQPPFSYQLDNVSVAVPEPTALALLLAVILVVAAKSTQPPRRLGA